MSGARTRARRAVLQALYQWQMTGDGPVEVTRQFREEGRLDNIDDALFERLVQGVMNAVESLDEQLGQTLDRPTAQLDPVERAILRLGTYELAHCPDVPFKVVINEAIDLARRFGAQDGHRYVNGVLEQVARVLRPHETGPRRGR